MKRTTVTVVCLACLACLGPVDWVFASALFHHYPAAMLTIKAVDEEGAPLPDTSVHVWLSEGAVRDGKTDRNGLFVAKGECTEDKVPISVGKTGYYQTAFAYAFPAVVERYAARWEPWNPVVTAVVRRVVNPIPMYAKRVETTLPTVDGTNAYDLAIGDWVAPHGRGKENDMLFRITRRRLVSWGDFDASLAIACPSVHDGFQARDETKVGGSTFGWSYNAPSNDYSQSWQVTVGYLPGRGYFATNGTRAAYIRVRSVTNELGQLVQANYGKLLGPVEFDVRDSPSGWIRFTYYLNPTPNDRNMEFDPNRNLFKNLGEFETVSQP